MGSEYFQRILEVRTQKGLTQKQLAEAARIAPGSLSAYEQGQKAPPVDAAARIAKALGVSLDWLFGFEEGKEGGAPKTYGDVIKALIPLTQIGFRVVMGKERCDNNGFIPSDEEVMSFDEMIGSSVDGGRFYGEYPYSDWAFLRFNSDKLIKFFDSWSKLYKLYADGEVEEEVYQIWLDKRIEDLSAEPLPIKGGFVPVSDGELPF